jgi:hypothetical protein
MDKNVGDMDGNGRREAAGRAVGRPMMQRDGFDHRVGQAPKAEQISAQFGVRRAKYLPLDFPHRAAGLARGAQNRFVAFRQAGSQNQLPDIME